mgnify:FL=1
MTKYREILRLHNLNLSQQRIAESCNVSKKTVNRVLKQAKELGISWPLGKNITESALASQLFPQKPTIASKKRMPDYAYIQKELLRNGVSKKLLWTEYLELCRANGEEALMYSQFCYHIQQDEQKRRATMHIKRKPGEQIEVDWAGDTAVIINPDTGKATKAYIFVGVLSYSQYTYVEAFPDMKLSSWIAAHIHMYEFFSGVLKIVVPDNCKTAVTRTHNYEYRLNETYQELAEHYGTAIIPARVRSPKDKASVEGTVGNVSTWIVAVLRKEQFFSLNELNCAIKEKLDEFNQRPFQKKEGSRQSLFLEEELPLLTPLPSARFELSDWKTATVQFNYHISVDGMLYSVPYEYIKKKVDVRVTATTIEIFFQHNRIASHCRLCGRLGQYSTFQEHMPKDHQAYLEWNGERFLRWAKEIGPSVFRVISSILSSHKVEQQAYRSCIGLLKLSKKHSDSLLEIACKQALTYTATPSYKSIKNLLSTASIRLESSESSTVVSKKTKGITRGAAYYRRNKI